MEQTSEHGVSGLAMSETGAAGGHRQPGQAAQALNGNGHLDGNGHAIELLEALQAMRLGDFSVRLPSHHTGLAGKIADTFNDIVAANERMAQELEQVGQVVGRDGRTRTRVRFDTSQGAWGDMEGSVNTLIDDLCGRPRP